MDNKETAKRLLRHYLSLGKRLDADCLTEIDGIVDHIVAAAKDEMAAPPTAKPAPLQAPNPALTLGAAAEPDAPHLGVQFENGTWALTVGGLVHNGYDYGMALALAVTVGGVVRDIDEWKEEQMALHVQVAMGATVSDH